jgi:hypothetical protein
MRWTPDLAIPDDRIAVGSHGIKDRPSRYGEKTIDRIAKGCAPFDVRIGSSP